jgi:hypothetical protein
MTLKMILKLLGRKGAHELDFNIYYMHYVPFQLLSLSILLYGQNPTDPHRSAGLACTKTTEELMFDSHGRLRVDRNPMTVQ